MTWGAAMVASLFGTLARPRWWVVGLAGFLVRGGLILLIVPIIVIPTPAGLITLLSPLVIGFAFGGPSGGFVSFVIVAAVVLTAWLVAAGLIGAWTDTDLVRDVAADDELGLPGPLEPGSAWRAFAVRAAAHLPFVVALTWGAVEIGAALYAELIRPGDLVLPLGLRVIGRVPGPVVVIAVAWLAGEAAGGLAVRRLVMDRAAIGAAIAGGWLDLLGRPTSILTLVVTDLAVLATVAMSALAAGVVMDGLANGLRAAVDPVPIVGGVVAVSATWLVGLVLVGVAIAWRSAAWTFEVVRRRADVPRTFGASGIDRAGDWSRPDPSGTL